MSIRIVVGTNWGDEGKGRMVDLFAKDADYIVRYQGGTNAGHTVVNKFGKFKLHLIPSGIFYNHTTNILGPGTVVNFEALVDEINFLKDKGIDVNEKNYKVAERAIICFPYHKLQDEYEEERLGGKKFGSTKQGIAPVYSDKYLKYAIQVGAIFDKSFLRKQIERCLELKNLIFEKVYGKQKISVDEMFEWAVHFGDKIKPFVCNTIDLLDNAVKSKKNILLEAQLGTLRDIHYGILPFTTSSSPLSHFAFIGGGIFTYESPIVTGVMKAFSTCVGEGPFVTEIQGSLAEKLREVAHEYGAATGRPRRIGYFDAVASRFGARIQNATEIALTKLDSLSGLNKLKICTHYTIGKNKFDYFPLTMDLEKAKPLYIEMPGWEEEITDIRDYEKLPGAAKEYVEKIEKLVGVPVKYVSVGPERKQLIYR